MRQQLMRTFSEIYILDLHGSTKKKEVSPDGSKDENVFDIQPGVSLGIFIKKPDKTNQAKVYHAEMWGIRAGKYLRLFELDLINTEWKQLEPQSPFYFFVPIDNRKLTEYEQGWQITEVFPINSVGIVTARDHLTIHFEKEKVWNTINDFIELPEDKARQKYNLSKDVQDWKVHLAQEDLKESGPKEEKIVPILYRPFDIRFTYYTGRTKGFICRPRPEVMRQILGKENIALITSRLTKGETFRHTQATRHIVEVICMSPKTSNNGFVFPLYFFPKKDNPIAQPWLSGKDKRVPNLNSEFVRDLGERLKLKFFSEGIGDLKRTFGPEDVFNYIYAILHSPTYRERYSEFLKRDFPRVPLTSDRKLFRKLCGLGQELVALHLMEAPALSNLITSFPLPGDHLVAKGHPKYLAPDMREPVTGKVLKKGRVYINKKQYFDGVPPEVWEFYIGGYQVCEKWLKDRRGRTLDHHDKIHYQKIIVALKETIRLMAEIDQSIDHWPIQ